MTKKIEILKLEMPRNILQSRPEGSHIEKAVHSITKLLPFDASIIHHMVFKENNKKYVSCYLSSLKSGYLTSVGILHSVPETSALLRKLQCSCPQNQN